jgi:hypothetical protein
LTTQKEKIKEFARDLFLQVNEVGSKKYTLHDIAKQLQQKRKYSINVSNLSRWSKKYDWEGLFIKLKQAGIEQAKSDIENKVIDEKAQTIADIYKSNKSIQNLSKQTILSRLLGKTVMDKDGNEIKSDFGNTDLIRLLQHSEQTILTLHEKKIDPNEINVNLVRLTYKTMNDE